MNEPSIWGSYYFVVCLLLFGLFTKPFVSMKKDCSKAHKGINQQPRNNIEMILEDDKKTAKYNMQNGFTRLVIEKLQKTYRNNFHRVLGDIWINNPSWDGLHQNYTANQ